MAGETEEQPRRRTGRPTKLEPAVQTKIVLAITSGNDDVVAAQYAGITDRTFYNWMSRGEKENARREKGLKPKPDEDVFLQFFLAVKKARADAEVRNVAVIQQAAEKTWQAAAWWLERKHHERWGRKDHLTLGTDELDALIEQELQRLTDTRQGRAARTAAAAERANAG